jgi:serine/threonine protein kinase
MSLPGENPPDLDAPAVASRWSGALAGEPEPLRELAESYWYCIYAWWRRAGLEPESAHSATIAAVHRWVTSEPPRADEAQAARLREWLPARLNQLSSESLDAPAEAPISIDAEWAAQRYDEEPTGEADAIFQRRWALTILEFALAALREEYRAAGEETLFDELVAFAGYGQAGDEAYEQAAHRAGRSASAMRKAVFDFRTRQRDLLRAFAADTLADAADLESEMSALLMACDAAGPTAAAAPAPSVLRGVQPDQVLARAMNSVRMTSAGTLGWTPPRVEEVARLFPQHEVLRMLGHGGMGAVYEARQLSLDRVVAIKLLPLEISVDGDFAERFRREARAMAKLNHPNIISVHDFGQTAEGHLFFVMEFVDGAMLQELIHGADPVPASDALLLIEQVCDALAYAHEKGVVHRDIKPSNVMVSREGRVKVADFGLARLMDADPAHWGTTMTGVVMGTPDYMAPEQKRGAHVDHRADIYALGVLLYEALCKEIPQGVFEMPSKRCGLDKRVDAVVSRALASKPEDRFQSTAELKTAIETVRPAVAKFEASKGRTGPSRFAVATPASGRHAIEPQRNMRTVQIAAGLIALVAVALSLAFAFTRTRQTTASTPVPQAATPEMAGDNSSDQKRKRDLKHLRGTELGFRPLFDGKSLAGWQSANGTEPPPQCRITDGAITATGRAVLVSADEFDDFELRLEWKVDAEGNGGVLYRIPRRPGQTALPVNIAELQLGFATADAAPNLRTGALYSLLPPSKVYTGATKQWHEAAVIVRGPHVEHYVDEELYCSFDTNAPEFEEALRNANRDEALLHPGPGRVGLQFWSGVVSYRNIRIRSLGGPPGPGNRPFGPRGAPPGLKPPGPPPGGGGMKERRKEENDERRREPKAPPGAAVP